MIYPQITQIFADKKLTTETQRAQRIINEKSHPHENGEPAAWPIIPHWIPDKQKAFSEMTELSFYPIKLCFLCFLCGLFLLWIPVPACTGRVPSDAVIKAEIT